MTRHHFVTTIQYTTSLMSIPRFSLVVALSALLLVPASYGQNIESEVSTLADSLKEARADKLHLIAPEAFAEASEYLTEAKSKMEEGDKISDIRAAVQRGRGHLVDAKDFQDIGNVILEEALAARSDALAARAPEYAKEKWKSAEETIRSAGEEIEKGDQEDAREDAQEAVRYYRNAELKAIRANLLGTARDKRKAARQIEASEWARQTWKQAQAKLQKADRILKNDRYNRDESRKLAEDAAAQFTHARLLAEAAQRIDEDVERNGEKELLRYENHIRRMADTLGTEITFGDGVDAVTERLVASVKSLKDDRDNLQESLRERRERIDRLQQVIDSLDARLAELEEREEKVTAQLQEKRERERTLERVRNVFDQNEAEVLTSGNELIVRMQGLNFPSGSSDIQPKNFGLLTKLQRVIREFAAGSITVAGHTDARGNDARNMKLSEDRAQAVRQYLLANMDTDDDRITAVGRGESQPIATNETEQGRSKNRRIDVTIEFQ